MSMLNFKYGKFSGLFNDNGTNKLPLNEGTVYITTDEKAMYVDLHNGTSVERIRLSQIVNLPTITSWNNLKPPYSTEAFYYIIEANALLKYTGTEWKQINSTSELESALDRLAQTVSDLSGTVDQNAQTMNAHIATQSGNPHKVTKSDVGLGNVDNKSAATLQSEFKAGSISASETAKFATGAQVHAAVKDVADNLSSHVGTKTGNPHNVTKSDVGLGNVDNTSDINKPVSTAQAEAIEAAKQALLGNSSSAVGSATIAGANKAADAAQDYAEGVAGDLATHVGTVTGNPHKVTKADVGLGNVDNKSAATLKSEFTTDSIADGKSGFTTGDQVYEYVKALKDGYTGTLDDLDDAIKENAQNIATHVGTTTGNPHGVTKTDVGLGNVANKSPATLKSDFTAAGTGVTDGETGFTTGDQVFEYIKALKDGYTGTLDDLDDDIQQNATDIATNASAITALDSRLTGVLQATDALKYKGTVSAFSGLPTTSTTPNANKPEIGWTYKVVPPSGTNPKINPVFTLSATQANSGVSTPVYVGDLLIAVGTEDTVQTSGTYGKITSNLKWDHIPAGYVADYNPKFTLAGADSSGAGGVDSNNEVTLHLTSAAASADGDLGKIAFKTSGDSAIRISATNTASSSATLTLSLAWGTF